MASDVVALIKDDHRRMEQLFARLKAGDGARRSLVAKVEGRLSAHARAEESEVYPSIAKKAGEQNEVEHGTHEHFEAEHHLRKVINLIDSPHFDQALEEFVAAVDHHVQEEESELLPALQRLLANRPSPSWERRSSAPVWTTSEPPGTKRPLLRPSSS